MGENWSERRPGLASMVLADRLPIRVRVVAHRLTYTGGHAVYVVGGAVRDWLLGQEPHDIDLATTALPEEVLSLFPEGKDDGAEFGRVLVSGVDVLTLRQDGEYKDARHPSRVKFTDDIHLDLRRRDFTINAMAVEYPSGALIDPNGGENDLKLCILRAVGDASARFREDALRIMRGLRFIATMGMFPADGLSDSARANAESLRFISPERLQDELSRILAGRWAMDGLAEMASWGALDAVIPEFTPTIGCAQNCPHHHADVWGHTLEVVQGIAPELHLRLAALLHDVGKPRTKRTRDDGRDTFYNHDQVGADMARTIMERLRYPAALTERVALLVANHMFHFDQHTKPSAVRRMIARVGASNVDDLLELRRADHAGARNAGTEQGRSYQMLRDIADEVQSENQAITLRDLAINGHDVMSALNIAPGQAIRVVLSACLEHVLEHPEENTRDALLYFMRTQKKVGG